MEQNCEQPTRSAVRTKTHARRRHFSSAAITLAALALAMMVPSAGTAGTITNSFLTSSTGSAQLFSAGDTIQFEVLITTTAGRNYNTIFWSLTGDSATALVGVPSTWFVAVAHTITDWEWHYTPPGGGKVKIGTNGRHNTFPPPNDVGNPVTGPYGFFATNKTGDGIPALVGTVTITATQQGIYQGGAFFYPGIDTFFGSAGEEGAIISGGSFTVPEPGAPLLVMLGFGGLWIAGRTSKP